MFSQITGLWKQNQSSDVPVTGPDLGISGPYCSIEQLMRLRWSARTLALPKAKRVKRPQSGLHHSRFRGRGMEFSEVRTYHPGDDVRSIDWRVTARRQQPHTKIYNEERERPVLIVCDQSQSQFFGSRVTFKSVRAAESAALFAWTALSRNDRVGGIVFSEKGHQEIRPARSRKTILRILHAITSFNQALKIGEARGEQAFSFNDAMVEAIRLAKPGTLIVLISDFRHLTQDTEKQLSKLMQHNEILMVRTTDPLEDTLPPPGSYPLSDGQETLVINTQSRKTRDAYHNWAQAHTSHLNQLSQRCRAPFIEVSTSEPSLHALQRILIAMSK